MAGFGGTKEEMQLVTLLFESSSSIKRMHGSSTIARLGGEEKEGALGEQQRQDIERIHHEPLPSLPKHIHLDAQSCIYIAQGR
jgi:hypothetical protein